MRSIVKSQQASRQRAAQAEGNPRRAVSQGHSSEVPLLGRPRSQTAQSLVSPSPSSVVSRGLFTRRSASVRGTLGASRCCPAQVLLWEPRVLPRPAPLSPRGNPSARECRRGLAKRPRRRTARERTRLSHPRPASPTPDVPRPPSPSRRPRGAGPDAGGRRPRVRPGWKARSARGETGQGREMAYGGAGSEMSLLGNWGGGTRSARLTTWFPQRRGICRGE